ncbi:ABC transporter permease subunit [Candidatus Poribacteria bacterium]|nr:ABC transporter permease subunit [Candidatus Poribacteria bacterium]
MDWLFWIWRSKAYQSIYALTVIGLAVFLFWFGSRREYWVSAWRQIRTNKLAMVCMIVLCLYIAAGLMDSIGWADAIRNDDGSLNRDDNGRIIYEATSLTLLDRICKPLIQRTEKTYSAPLAVKSFSKEIVTTPDGNITRDYPRLEHAGTHLEDESDKGMDIFLRILGGFFIGLILGGIGSVILWLRNKSKIKDALFWGGVILVLGFIIASTVLLASAYHVLGTDKVGNDILYRALKGIKTALIIGGLTTALAVPFAIFFGVIAGYFGGRMDDIVQYIYTTLASIPSILLIIAFMLLFGRGLFNLCLIMGITSWTGLCRLLRGETLKLRELEYVQSARAFGVKSAKILIKHIVPNVMHIVLISFLLRFSGLVLAEAMLSYLQIGVEPTRGSWGSMIDIARMELAREPIVWWNLSAAFIFMVVLVLCANLFGDAVRDALDPRLRTE